MQSFLNLETHLKQREHESFMDDVKQNPQVAKYVTPPLLSLSLELTNQCPLRCTFCFAFNPKQSRDRPKGFMDWQLFKKLVDELETYSYSIYLGLNYSGESLLHPRFCDMLEYVSNKNFVLNINTNAWLLNNRIAEAMLSAPFEEITVSLSGLGDKHNQIRRGSDFKVIKDNILNLMRLRGSRRNPHIRIALTLSNHEPSEIQGFIQFWKPLVDEVFIGPCRLEDLSGVVDEQYFTMEKRPFCHKPMYSLDVLWNGQVTICCGDFQGLNALPNVNVHAQTIREVWRSPQYRDIRYQIATHTMNGLCAKCTAYHKRVFKN